MRYKHLLARPIAAVAVLGVAIIGLAGTAGATTISVSVPPVLGNAGSSPVVTVGSGSVAPVPGADVTVPVHGDSDVSVDSPTTSAAVPTAAAVPVAVPQGRLASAHSSIDACIAAALLSGHTPSGCGVTVVGSQPLADSLSQVGSSPSLAGALTQVGACVRLALATGQAIDTCSTPVVTAGPSPTAILGSAPVPVPISPAALDDGTVAGVLADNGLCSVGEQLGLSGLSGLSTCLDATGMPDASGGVNLSTSADGGNLSTAANGTTAASRWTGPSGSAAASGSARASGPTAATGASGTTGVSSASMQGASDLCLGLAAVTGADPGSCASTPVGGLSGRATANGSAGSAQQGTAGAAPAASASLNASCASRTSGGGGTSPFRSDAAGGFAGLGLVLAGLGRRLRRVKRPVLG